MVNEAKKKPKGRSLPEDISKEWMTINEAAACLGVSRATVTNRADEGVIRDDWYFGLRIINREDVLTVKKVG